MLIVNDNKSVVNTRVISATTVEGKEIEIASLYGAVDLNGGTSYNFSILNADIYNENKEVIDTEIAAFKAEINSKIAELGGITV